MTAIDGHVGRPCAGPEPKFLVRSDWPLATNGDAYIQVIKKDTWGSGFRPQVQMIAAASRSRKNHYTCLLR